MAIFKVTFEVQRIVFCESIERAVELARSDIADSDMYRQSNIGAFELEEYEVKLSHNKLIPIIR